MLASPSSQRNCVSIIILQNHIDIIVALATFKIISACIVAIVLLVIGSFVFSIFDLIVGVLDLNA